MSVSQWLSVGSVLVPFLRHCDPVRGSMAFNMMRQAVPVLGGHSPAVGTGWEAEIADLCRATLRAPIAGRVVSVDATEIILSAKDSTALDVIKLPSMTADGRETCPRWKPSVDEGDIVEAGERVADGPAVDGGELALGRDVSVAFMSWYGYNFEDAVVVSERLVREDWFTSLHVKEYICRAVETKFGDEEITADIKNVSGRDLVNLNEDGTPVVGSFLDEGSIIVGRVTPEDRKDDSTLTPEEKLVAAMWDVFGPPVKDTSLRMPAGEYGVVVDVDVTADGYEDDEDDIEEVEGEIDWLRWLGINEVLRKAKGWSKVEADTLEAEMSAFLDDYEDRLLAEESARTKARKARRKSSGADVVKEVRVKVATRRRLQVGDKIAGRHGNKSIVSVVVPDEDMPFDPETGEHVDVVLNPLGVPSRMNLGQLLEIHLGAALDKLREDLREAVEEERTGLLLRTLELLFDRKEVQSMKEVDAWSLAADLVEHGPKAAAPPFGGMSDKEVVELLENMGLDSSGQKTLCDGKTGEEFDRPCTVGKMHLMKLHHMVEKKMHARSTGPRKLITRQPTKGRAKRGGQRLGEMEVWALQAYGAVYNLQEMMTVKSDHDEGRKAVFDWLTDGSREDSNKPPMGELMREGTMPESAFVLLNELRALGFDVRLEKDKDEAKKETSSGPDLGFLEYDSSKRAAEKKRELRF